MGYNRTMTSVGVDIGGSGARVALVGEGATVGEVHRCHWGEPAPERIVDAVAELVRPLAPDRVGVGVPGFVRDGVVLGSPNLPGLRDWPLADRLADVLGCPVGVHNDANAAALGAWASDGRRRDLLLLTLGTGVGGGVISQGRLVTGRRGVACELGHIHIGGDQPCGCGTTGCLETWFSTSGWRRRAADRGLAIDDGADLLARIDHDPVAAGIVREGQQALAHGLRTLLNTFAPEALALTGGLSLARGIVAPAVEQALATSIPSAVDGLEVIWLGRADTLAIAGAVEAV